jgi:hypothetical protein
MSDATDIVNTGINVIKLIANHAGVSVVQGGYANGLPHGKNADELVGWQHTGISKRWYHASEWYEILDVDMDFTVGLRWNYGGHDGSSDAKYVDQVTVTLDVNYLPPDQTVDVTANFPSAGVVYDNGPGLGFTTVVEMKHVFGQVESWRKSFDCLVNGDGTFRFG